jgi:DNA-binding NtrC family response regulator
MEHRGIECITNFLVRNITGLERLTIRERRDQTIHEALVLFLKLENGEADIGLASELNQKVSQIVEQGSEDVGFAALGFYLGIHSASWRRRMAEADSLLSRFRSFTQKEKDPAVLLLFHLAEWRARFKEKNYEQEVQSLDAALPFAGERGSSTWLLIKTTFAESAIWHGKLAVAEKELLDLKSFAHVRPWQGLAPYEYLESWYYQRLGNLNKALEILERMPLSEMKGREGMFTKFKVKLLISTHRFDEVRKILDSTPLYKDLPWGMNVLIRRHLHPVENEIFRAREALARRDLETARHYSQRAIDTAYESEASILPEGQILLVQIELCARRNRSARLQLQTIDPEATKFPVEWFRLYLLEGKQKEAQEMIRICASKVSVLQLKDKLGYAYEISAADLAEFLIPNPLPKPAPSFKPSKDLPASSDSNDDLVLLGETNAIQEIRKKIQKYASIDSAILITGETGTGKEVLTKLLHQKGDRSNEPFLALNCGAMSETLIQSELFGHAKGAFTGATNDRPGLFVAAGKGTLFLDEISSMSSSLQASLLRVLEANEVMPVGSNRTYKVRARIIAATNEPLDDLVAQKKFRMDLYFRLAHLQIQLPPLRERQEDIPLLAKFFLKRHFRNMEVAISDEFLEALKKYSWPGNVRELRTEMERMAMLLGDDHVLTASHFEQGRTERPSFLQPTPQPSVSIPQTVTPDVTPIKQTFEGNSYRVTRLQQILKLFEQKEKVTRAEVINLIHCSPKTAMLDLQFLVEKSMIRRVETSKHLKTSYYVRV